MNTQILNGEITSYVVAHPWIIILLVWSSVWKFIAMWKAAKNNNITIFIVIGVVNTAGILEIIYLLYLYFKSKKTKEIAK